MFWILKFLIFDFSRIFFRVNMGPGAETSTRGPRTLALCLTAAVGMTLAIFCRLSKTQCFRLNQLKPRLTLTQYLTMHVSVLDHIRHLNFHLSGSLKVKCDSVTGLPIYGFLLVFNSNGLTQLLYEIEAFEI